MKNKNIIAALALILYTGLHACDNKTVKQDIYSVNEQETIKGFSSAQEAKEAYICLLKEEQSIKKSIKKEQKIEKKVFPSNILHLSDSEDGDQEIDMYHEKLERFYQKLFRFIVKQDIKKKRPYTLILGLKETSDGNLTMDRLPIKYDKIGRHYALLFELSLYPNNTSLINKLKRYNKPNTDPHKSADAFFPQIGYDSDYSLDGLNGEYSIKNNIIRISPEKFSIENCEIMLHEFTHARQGCQSGCKSSLMNKNFARFPHVIALELDAEYESVRLHPCPDHLFELMRDACKGDFSFLTKFAKAHFPYLTPVQTYFLVHTYHHQSKKNDADYMKKEEPYLERAKKLQVLMTGSEIENIITACLKDNNYEETKKFSNCVPLIDQTRILEKEFIERTKKIKNRLLKTEKSAEKRAAITKEPACFFSSEKFFKIKCAALGISPEQKS